MNEELASALFVVYQKAFNDYAGPPQFRHSCNYNDYHKAALLAVHDFAQAAQKKKDAEIARNCRRDDGAINRAANERIAKAIEGGGE